MLLLPSLAARCAVTAAVEMSDLTSSVQQFSERPRPHPFPMSNSERADHSVGRTFTEAYVGTSYRGPPALYTQICCAQVPSCICKAVSEVRHLKPASYNACPVQALAFDTFKLGCAPSMVTHAGHPGQVIQSLAQWQLIVVVCMWVLHDTAAGPDTNEQKRPLTGASCAAGKDGG